MPCIKISIFNSIVQTCLSPHGRLYARTQMNRTQTLFFISSQEHQHISRKSDPMGEHKGFLGKQRRNLPIYSDIWKLRGSIHQRQQKQGPGPEAGTQSAIIPKSGCEGGYGEELEEHSGINLFYLVGDGEASKVQIRGNQLQILSVLAHVIGLQ